MACSEKKIKKLKRADGGYSTNQEEMGELATSFFSNLYSSDQNINPQFLLRQIESKFTEAMNETLCKDFTSDEINDALFQIGPLKASWPDGFPARFFQRNWDVLKEDTITAVRYLYQRKMTLMS